MKNILAVAVLLYVAALVGQTVYKFVKPVRDENMQVRAVDRDNEQLCMQALRKAALPTAQQVPHFLDLGVWPRGTSRTTDAGHVVHAAARVVTLENSKDITSAADYMMDCLIKDGVVTSNVLTPTP